MNVYVLRRATDGAIVSVHRRRQGADLASASVLASTTIEERELLDDDDDA